MDDDPALRACCRCASRRRFPVLGPPAEKAAPRPRRANTRPRDHRHAQAGMDGLALARVHAPPLAVILLGTGNIPDAVTATRAASSLLKPVEARAASTPSRFRRNPRERMARRRHPQPSMLRVPRKRGSWRGAVRGAAHRAQRHRPKSFWRARSDANHGVAVCRAELRCAAGQLLESELFGHVKAPSRAQCASTRDSSRPRTAARSSSTKSATCRSASR